MHCNIHSMNLFEITSDQFFHGITNMEFVKRPAMALMTSHVISRQSCHGNSPGFCESLMQLQRTPFQMDDYITRLHISGVSSIVKKSSHLYSRHHFRSFVKAAKHPTLKPCELHGRDHHFRSPLKRGKLVLPNRVSLYDPFCSSTACGISPVKGYLFPESARLLAIPSIINCISFTDDCKFVIKGSFFSEVAAANDSNHDRALLSSCSIFSIFWYCLFTLAAADCLRNLGTAGTTQSKRK